jgi:hypothetical protein
MDLTKLYAGSEIEYCVRMYMDLNDEQFMPASFETSYRTLFSKCRQGHFIRCIKDNSKIIAWIYADQVQLMHTNYRNFQQIYYCSDQTGVKAYRSVVMLHNEMWLYSENLSTRYCVSIGSHNDEYNTFSRILEKNGWHRRGYAAYRESRPGKGPR